MQIFCSLQKEKFLKKDLENIYKNFKEIESKSFLVKKEKIILTAIL